MSVWPGFPPAGMTAMLIGILIAETLFAVSLRNYRRISYVITYIIALAVFAFHVWYFIDQRALNKYPSEFSHISYFIFSVSVIVGGRKMQSLASFCGLVTGIGFIIGGCFSPASMLSDAENGATLVISVLRHEILYLGGLLLFLNVGRFYVKDIWIPFLGIALIVVYSLLMYHGIIYPDFAKPEGMVIVKIVYGTILGYVIPGELPVWLRVFTVILVLALVAGAMFGFYAGNRKLNALRDRKNAHKGKIYGGGKPSLRNSATMELGLLPLAVYLLKRAGKWKTPKKTFEKRDIGAEKMESE